ncbi:MAG: MMPL family transporter, partial [Rudaea sp.]
MNVRSILWLVGWLLLLAALAFGIRRNLVLSSDLRSFMPPAQTADQKLLLDQIGEGPASRLLLLAIAGAPAEQLATLSRDLVRALRDDAHFARALDGQTDLSALAPALLPYRFLLSPTLDNATFDTAYLRDELQQRVEDLGSPAAAMLKPLLAHDPTLETLKLAQRWAPLHAPQLRDGVWFAADGSALLLAETTAPAFDPAAQGAAITALQ